MSNQAPSRADSRRLHERGGGGKDGDGETWLLHSGREVLSRSRPDFVRPRRSELVSIFVYPFSIPFGIWSKRWRERERNAWIEKSWYESGFGFFFSFFFSFEIIGIKKLRWSGNERLVETFERFILSFFLLAFSFSFSPSPEPSKPVKEDIAPLPNLPRYSHAASMDFTSAGYNVLKIFQNPVTKDYILNPCHSHPLLVAGYGRI